MKRSTRLSFNRRSLALFASLGVASGMAVAQPVFGPAPTSAAKTHASQEASTFGKLDTDGNGSISRKEAAGAGGFVARNFDALDTNHDGQLSRAEFERASK